MKQQTKDRYMSAYLNAVELINNHAEVGFMKPQDVGECDEQGLEAYVRVCKTISKRLEKMANKYSK